MLTTAVFAAMFVGLLLAPVILWAMFLRLGLKWAKVPNVTTRRVVMVTVATAILQGSLNVLSLISTSSDAQSVVFGLLKLAATVFVACFLISTLFKAHFLRALQAWLPTLLADVTTIAFVSLVLKPFLYEASTLESSSMAPTLIGQHWLDTCRLCGKPNYCKPRDERNGNTDPQLMICDNLHVTEASDIDKTVHSCDRVMIAKFLAPKRWDLVVFRYPEQPSTMFVMRLVGLPGEKIHIQGGSVWVDGVRQTPPDSIRGIEYLSELPGWSGADLWGSANRTAQLGDDEYFVLGDFSARSKDSRLWEQGAPGHNPFAVPESYMKGVVTHTYWPPSRWHIHR